IPIVPFHGPARTDYDGGVVFLYNGGPQQRIGRKLAASKDGGFEPTVRLPEIGPSRQARELALLNKGEVAGNSRLAGSYAAHCPDGDDLDRLFRVIAQGFLVCVVVIAMKLGKAGFRQGVLERQG